MTMRKPEPDPSVVPLPNGTGTMRHGTAGTAYRLQRAPSASGPWSSTGPQTAPASGLVEFWDLFAPPGQGFYRARVE